MTYAFGSVWIVGSARLEGEPQAILTRVDPSTDRVVATIGLGGMWGADVSATSDAVWVATFADPVAQVVRVDPATDLATDTIDLKSDYVSQIEAVDDVVVAEELVWPSDERGALRDPDVDRPPHETDPGSRTLVAVWRRRPDRLAWAGLAVQRSVRAHRSADRSNVGTRVGVRLWTVPARVRRPR